MCEELGCIVVDLSIIVPIYNLESFLEQCLGSLVRQNTKYNYEVICVNDGSQDQSQIILERFQNKYPSIIRIFQNENEGVSIARNFGISKSIGKYITFVDGDDWVKETMVEDCLTAIYESDLDLLITDGIHVFDNKTEVVKEEVEAFVFNTENHVCGKVFKKSILEKYELLFPKGVKVGEDFTFTFSYLMLINSYLKINAPFYYYRRNRPGSVMSNRKKLTYKDIFNACNALVDFSQEHSKYEQHRENIEYVFIKNVIVRMLPKIIYKYFPNYLKIKSEVNEQQRFMNSHFPNWLDNKHFQNDLEGYFTEKLGDRYIHYLEKITKGNYIYFFCIFLNKIKKKK